METQNKRLNFNTDETEEERENQKKQLIQFLKENDSVDPLQAWLKIGIYRLSARVYDLRTEGYQIVTEKKEVYNCFNKVVKVASYSLKKYALKKDEQYFFDVIKGGRHSLTNSVFLAKRFTAKEAKSFNDGFEVVRI